MDTVRLQADRYFSKTFLDSKLSNSPLYLSFFTTKNFEDIVRTVETNYNVQLNEIYRREVFDAMLRCFEYHPPSLELLNRLVYLELRPKLQNLIMDQVRYRNNMYDNATTTFIVPLDIPEQVCHRKESLSFYDALFGRKGSNVEAFSQFKTG